MTRSIGDAMHSKAVISDPEIKSFVVIISSPTSPAYTLIFPTLFSPQVGPEERVRLIMASDGMWRVFDNKLTRKLMKKIKSPSMAANRLCLESLWRTQRHTYMKLDDVTVGVVDIVGSRYNSPAASEAQMRDSPVRSPVCSPVRSDGPTNDTNDSNDSTPN
eukprot:1344211-Amorphochlora_amoeboformis.AAC.1